MGFFGKSKDAAKAVGSGVIGVGKIIASPALKKIDKANKAIRKGTCPGCQKPVTGAKKGKDIMYHLECAKKAKEEVEKWQKGSGIPATHYANGKNKLTSMHYPCGCNRLNTFHNCQHNNGERIADNIRIK